MGCERVSHWCCFFPFCLRDCLTGSKLFIAIQNDRAIYKHSQNTYNTAFQVIGTFISVILSGFTVCVLEM